MSPPGVFKALLKRLTSSKGKPEKAEEEERRPTNGQHPVADQTITTFYLEPDPVPPPPRNGTSSAPVSALPIHSSVGHNSIWGQHSSAVTRYTGGSDCGPDNNYLQEAVLGAIGPGSVANSEANSNFWHQPLTAHGSGLFKSYIQPSGPPSRVVAASFAGSAPGSARSDTAFVKAAVGEAPCDSEELHKSVPLPVVGSGLPPVTNNHVLQQRQELHGEPTQQDADGVLASKLTALALDKQSRSGLLKKLSVVKQWLSDSLQAAGQSGGPSSGQGTSSDLEPSSAPYTIGSEHAEQEQVSAQLPAPCSPSLMLGYAESGAMGARTAPHSAGHASTNRKCNALGCVPELTSQQDIDVLLLYSEAASPVGGEVPFVAEWNQEEDPAPPEGCLDEPLVPRHSSKRAHGPHAGSMQAGGEIPVQPPGLPGRAVDATTCDQPSAVTTATTTTAATVTVDSDSSVASGSMQQQGSNATNIVAIKEAGTPKDAAVILQAGTRASASMSNNLKQQQMEAIISDMKCSSMDSYVAPPASSLLPAVERTKTISVASHCPMEIFTHNWAVEDFSLLRKLYEGSLSVVCQAQHRKSGRHVALKIYKRSRLHEMERFQLAREICLHVRVLHPYIISLYSAWKDAKYVYLALEWAPRGNLLDFLVSRGGRLQEEEAATIVVKPLFSALAFLHSQNFIHRDIKLENIIMDASCNVKLADFGLAIDQKFEQANTRLGTFGYFAPEVLDCPLKKGPFDFKDQTLRGYDSKVDVWSAGVVTYELLTGTAPFSASSATKIMEAIRNRPIHYPSELSPEARDFLEHALERDPVQRWTAKQLQAHPWILRWCK